MRIFLFPTAYSGGVVSNSSPSGINTVGNLSTLEDVHANSISGGNPLGPASLSSPGMAYSSPVYQHTLHQQQFHDMNGHFTPPLPPGPPPGKNGRKK